MSRLSLQNQFTTVYGGDTPKSEALRQIAAANPERSVVFFGDSIGDHEAAVLAKVDFVAVACERDNFENMPVVKIRDFANQAILDRAMRDTLSRRAAS